VSGRGNVSHSAAAAAAAELAVFHASSTTPLHGARLMRRVMHQRLVDLTLRRRHRQRRRRRRRIETERCGRLMSTDRLLSRLETAPAQCRCFTARDVHVSSWICFALRDKAVVLNIIYGHPVAKLNDMVQVAVAVAWWLARPNALREDPGANLTADGSDYRDGCCDVQPRTWVAHLYCSVYWSIQLNRVPTGVKARMSTSVAVICHVSSCSGVAVYIANCYIRIYYTLM